MAADRLDVQVVRCLLSSRLPASPEASDEVERKLSSLTPSTYSPSSASTLHIRVAIGHSECRARCARAIPIECWSIGIEERGQIADGEMTLLPVFLLNAVRSHVHFSQLSSWLARCQDGEKGAISASYETTSSPSHPLPLPLGATLVHHVFPSSVDPATGHRLRVAVSFIARDEMVTPGGMCLMMGALPTDEWHSPVPSPLPSPSGRDDMGIVVETALAASTRDTLINGVKALAAAQLYPPAISTPVGPARRTLPPHDGVRLAPAPKRERTVSPRPSPVQQLQRPRKRHQPLGRGPMVGSFEESALAGRIGGEIVQEGWSVQIAASGPALVCSPTTLPLETTALAAEGLGGVNLSRGAVVDAHGAGPRGCRIPERGLVQMTLLTPEQTARSVFIVQYDVSGMPPRSCTMLRQRIGWTSRCQSPGDGPLRYLVQLSLRSDSHGRVYIHGDVRILFSTDASLEGMNIEASPSGLGRDTGKFSLSSKTSRPEWSALPRKKRATVPSPLVHSTIPTVTLPPTYRHPVRVQS